ncbi:MAG: glycosyltransferase [Planctomycetota bacterium]
MSALSGKRLVVVLSTLGLGGAEGQALLLARGLQARGAEVLVWALSPAAADEAPLHARCRALGIVPELRRCGWPRPRPRRLAGLARFAAWLRLARADAVLPFCAAPNLVAGLSWRAGGARLCVWNQRDAGLDLTGAPLERLAARLSPLVVSNSLHGARRLSEVLEVDPARVTHLPNAVELAPPGRAPAAWRATLGVSEATFVAVMLASLSADKDHATLLRAWARVRERRADALLLLAGADAGTGPRLRDLARELGLAEGVRFLDRVEDVSGLLGAADLLVHSSRAEGLPNAVLEGMAAGRVVVATDTPGAREALAAGRADLAGDLAPQLAPVGAARALADALVRWLEDAPGRAAAGAANRARVAELGAEHLCARFAWFLEEALQTRGRRS